MAENCSSCSIEITPKSTKYCTRCGALLYRSNEQCIDHSSRFFYKKSDSIIPGPNNPINFRKNTRLKGNGRIPGMSYINNYLLIPSFDDNCYYIFIWDGKEFIQKWQIKLSSEIKIVSTPISDGIFLNILDGNEIIRFRIKRNGESEEFRHTFYPTTINALLPDPVFYENDLERYLITYLSTTSEIIVIDISKKDVINQKNIKYLFSNERIGLVSGQDRVFLYNSNGEIVIIPMIDLMSGNITNSKKLTDFSEFAYRPVYRDNHLHLFCKRIETLFYYKLDISGRVISSNNTVVNGLPKTLNYPIIKGSHFLLLNEGGDCFVKIFSNFMDKINCGVKYSSNHYLVVDETSYLLSQDYESLIRVDNETLGTVSAGMAYLNVINDLCYGDGNIFIQTDDKIFIKNTF